MHRTRRRHFLITLPAAFALGGCAATPGRVSQTEPVTPVDAPLGVALDGYDVVAYFDAGTPIEGDASSVHVWRGARWQFASPAHRDAFAADPLRYAPQYGGWCAYAMAHGFIARGHPRQWAIVGERLYVNNNWFAMSLWDKDRPGHIVAADANWPLIPKRPLPAEGLLAARSRPPVRGLAGPNDPGARAIG